MLRASKRCLSGRDDSEDGVLLHLVSSWSRDSRETALREKSSIDMEHSCGIDHAGALVGYEGCLHTTFIR